jgi:predicted RNase H-related nuclease YkuK (DUF458 family)
MIMVYRKLQDGTQVELDTYIKDYIVSNPNIEILVGCDSQNSKDKTIYAIVVALYTPGRGAHVLYRKWAAQREWTRSVRLLNEVWFAVETAEDLQKAGIQKATWIDVDLNPDPKYKSNEVFRQAVGMVEGMGYKVRYKTFGTMATYCADHLVKM